MKCGFVLAAEFSADSARRRTVFIQMQGQMDSNKRVKAAYKIRVPDKSQEVHNHRADQLVVSCCRFYECITDGGDDRGAGCRALIMNPFLRDNT